MATVDLAAKREERRASRASQDAAGREARSETLEIRDGETLIATLHAEFPLGALAALREIDTEIGLLLSRAVSLYATRANAGEAIEAAQLFADLLGASENLPGKLLSVAQGVGEGLLGADGLARFLAIPEVSVQDVGALVGTIFEFYGVGPGESSGSSESQTSDGPTSNQTLPASTPESTPEMPSETPATLAS